MWLLKRIERKLDAILDMLYWIERKENKAMATLDDVLAGVAEEKTQIDGLATLTANIKAQLDAALAGTLTPEQQAKVDSIFASVQAGTADAVAAINANTPAAAKPAG